MLADLQLELKQYQCRAHPGRDIWESLDVICWSHSKSDVTRWSRAGPLSGTDHPRCLLRPFRGPRHVRPPSTVAVWRLDAVTMRRSPPRCGGTLGESLRGLDPEISRGVSLPFLLPTLLPRRPLFAGRGLPGPLPGRRGRLGRDGGRRPPWRITAAPRTESVGGTITPSELGRVRERTRGVGESRLRDVFCFSSTKPQGLRYGSMMGPWSFGIF